MSYESGKTTAAITGSVTTTAPDPFATAVITQINFTAAAGVYTGAVPASKRWRVVAVNAAPSSYVSIYDGTPTLLGRITQTGAAENTSVSGPCVAILTTGQKLRYNGDGCISYIEEAA